MLEPRLLEGELCHWELDGGRRRHTGMDSHTRQVLEWEREQAPHERHVLLREGE